MTQSSLPDYCLYFIENTRRPCYAVAGFVVVRPSGEVLSYTCEGHREAWSERVRGPFRIVSREEWEISGGGYRGVMLGG